MMLRLLPFVLLANPLLLGSCVFNQHTPEVPMTPGRQSPMQAPAIEIPTSAVKQVEPEEAKASDAAPASSSSADPCFALNIEGRPPFYLKEHGFLVTNIIKSCVTRDGHRGFERGSPWMAMGLPCTGGLGRVKVDGKSYNPTEIHFDLSTNCPMLPGSLDLVRQHAVASLGISPQDQLLAFTPLSVQFWEFVNFPDTGMGTDVRIWTGVGLKDAWPKFQKRESLAVRLYGRENAWVSQAVIYIVEAQITPLSPNQFSLQVQDVRPISAQEQTAAATRCRSIQPPLNCGKIF